MHFWLRSPMARAPMSCTSRSSTRRKRTGMSKQHQAARASSPPASTITDQQHPLQQRVVELLELFLEGLAQAPDIPIQQKMMLESGGPLILMAILQIEISKLQRLVGCLNGILQAVNDSAFSQQQ